MYSYRVLLGAFQNLASGRPMTVVPLTPCILKMQGSEEATLASHLPRRHLQLAWSLPQLALELRNEHLMPSQ